MSFEDVSESLAIVRAMVNEVLPIEMSIAQKATLAVDLLEERGELGALRQAAISGFNREISHKYSDMKKASDAASEQILKDIEEASQSDQVMDTIIRQLSFPVINPGEPPTALSASTHTLIKGAYFKESEQLRGRRKNIARLRHYMLITAPWPDTPIAVLIRRGDLTAEDFLMPSEREDGPEEMQRAA